MTNRQLHHLISIGLCAMFVVLAGITTAFTGYVRWQHRAHRAEMCRLEMVLTGGTVHAATISSTIPSPCR